MCHVHFGVERGDSEYDKPKYELGDTHSCESCFKMPAGLGEGAAGMLAFIARPVACPNIAESVGSSVLVIVSFVGQVM